MQNLSKFAATAFVVLALTGAAFMRKTSLVAASSAASSAVALAKAEASAKAAPSTKTTTKPSTVNVYWWYSAFDGSYNDYETLSYEIWEMEIYYDCTVNTTPGGGTLIEKGFWPNNNPNYPPMEFLYAHFR